MKNVVYTSPFVPPEWIAAHGLRPGWLQLDSSPDDAAPGPGRGVCPFAGAVLAVASAEKNASAYVFTTTCDQMRYAAALLEPHQERLVFLMNVPSTWQTITARQMYADELQRLGRFLERLGAVRPSAGELTEWMLAYDRARRELTAVRERLTARDFARGLVNLRCHLGPPPVATATSSAERGVPLALVGGPLLRQDSVIFDRVQQAGGRIVLDATEGGERTLPDRFHAERVRRDPFAELARAYFEHIPDVFRRPNTALYEWLEQRVRERAVRGIVLRRYVWCDLWHGELDRLRQWSPVPVLELDMDRDDDHAHGRTLGRLEAFVETLT